MTLSLTSPATVMDLAACARSTTPQLWALAQVQVRLGRSFVLRTAEGDVVICGGFVTWAPDPEIGHAWFMPSVLAARHMVSAVRACRQAMAAVLTGNPPAYVRLIVFVSTPEGRRIAAASGFHFLATRSDGMEVYST